MCFRRAYKAARFSWRQPCVPSGARDGRLPQRMARRPAPPGAQGPVERIGARAWHGETAMTASAAADFGANGVTLHRNPRAARGIIAAPRRVPGEGVTALANA